MEHLTGSDTGRPPAEPREADGLSSGWVLEFMRPDGEWVMQTTIHASKLQACEAARSMTPIRPKHWRPRRTMVGECIGAAPAEREQEDLSDLLDDLPDVPCPWCSDEHEREYMNEEWTFCPFCGRRLAFARDTRQETSNG